MAGRRRSSPPRRMGPDLLRLLDGPIVSRRRSRPPAPPRGMGPNHPRAAGGSVQRVSRPAATHQRNPQRCALCLCVRDGLALWCRRGAWRVLHVPPRKDYRTSNVLLVKLTRLVRHIGRTHAEGAITPHHCSVCAVHPPRAHRLHLSRWGVKDAPRFSSSG